MGIARVDKNEKYEKIKQFVEDKGGILLESEYVNSSTKMSFICSFCGEVGSKTSTGIFRSNACCSACRYERSRLKLNRSSEEIEKIFSKNGCLLLTSYKQIKNGKSILDFVCKCGEEERKTLNAFLLTPCCNQCSKKRKAQDNSNEATKKDILREFGKYDGKLISINSFNGLKSSITFICEKCTKRATKLFSSFKKFPMCTNCARRKNVKINYSYVYSYVINNSNATIISESYVNLDSPLKFLCKCGNEFTTSFHRFKYENKRQCNKCGIEMRAGENSPFWKGGVTTENVLSRQSKEYIHWREQVFKRDRYTCQCCGDIQGGSLNAHHIENFSTHKNKRFDLNNGITLCKYCHDFRHYGSFHHTYGTRNNDLKQLLEYIENYNFECFMNT